MATTNRVEGVKQTLEALREFPRSTGRATLRRALVTAAQPVAILARNMAPVDEANLARSIVVSTQLTRSQRRERPKANEVEVYVGPASGAAAGSSRYALNYASFVEFGTIDTAAQPYMRPAWDRAQPVVMSLLARELTVEYEAAAARLSRKFFKLR